MNRLIRFARLPVRDQGLIVEAAANLVLAGLILKTVPFARTARRLGEHMAESGRSEDAQVVDQALRVRWAVGTAARNLPWKPVCFPQAVAATRMLRRRSIRSTLYLGVDPQRDMDAHAWVRVGELIVTGGPLDRRFTVVSTFA
jgi:hypothetical protein